ncbi:hypothetical protein Bca52824_047364 [Brassica carinata]|uniref:Strictosidine synthase conserved region domain-containing protein n=1 Tax=Brassica carinata TaxID=52824 RepID=A0A8X7UPW8_BRACI|nr:hypothetical protein Bca52824_047364 [Brassica carinata]
MVYRQMCVSPSAPELEHVCGRSLAKPLVTEAEGQPFRFTNDLDIDEHEDVIYFTDTSTRFRRRRLIKYERSSKEVTVLLQGIAFANGVALSKDQILRLWLSGPNAGAQDVFSQLPGFPDNIRRNSNGEFWVALHSKERDLVLRLPMSGQRLHSLFTGGRPHATALKLSESREVLEVSEDKEGKRLRFISEVEEKDGKALDWFCSYAFSWCL